jgi:hypothetical protein
MADDDMAGLHEIDRRSKRKREEKQANSQGDEIRQERGPPQKKRIPSPNDQEYAERDQLARVAEGVFTAMIV